MKEPSNYWDKRAIERLKEAEKTSDFYINRIEKIYEQAYKNIDMEIAKVYKNYSKETGLDTQKLKELLTRSETEKEWKKCKKQGLDKYIKDNYKSRISRLERIQAQIYGKAKLIYPKEQLEHTMCYRGIINNSYYRAIYDTQMGTKYDFTFDKIDNNLVNSILSEKWSGKNYSQRIWKNTDILADSISQLIGGALLSGQSIEKTIKQFKDRFKVAENYAKRLVRTETNYFNNIADAMAYEEMEIDKYVFVATLDNRTSPMCQDHDNKVYNYKDKVVGVNFPPLHPYCRSKTRGYLGEEAEKMLKRRARDPLTGKNKVIDNISYKDWAKRKGIVTEQVTMADNKNLKNTVKNDIIKIDKHYIANGKNLVDKWEFTEDDRYSEDGGLKRIQKIQGYDKLPRLVNDKEFEEQVKDSGFFAQRTYAGKNKEEVLKYQNDLYKGEWYIECSVGGSQYGKGMYTASCYDLNNEAYLNGITEEMRHYIKLNSMRNNTIFIIEDITLDKSAKIIEYEKIKTEYMKQIFNNKEYDRFINTYEGLIDIRADLKIKYMNSMYVEKDLEQANIYFKEYNKSDIECNKYFKSLPKDIQNAYKDVRGIDPSVLAVEMGYDVIKAVGHGKSGSYSVILNRTKLIIRKGGKLYGK